jgi:hypothetical protein
MGGSRGVNMLAAACETASLWHCLPERLPLAFGHPGQIQAAHTTSKHSIAQPRPAAARAALSTGPGPRAS